MFYVRQRKSIFLDKNKIKSIFLTCLAQVSLDSCSFQIDGSDPDQVNVENYGVHVHLKMWNIIY